ncbi:MAG: hypothetical protein CMP51_03745 [Flavobacteriales bacterium]|nr:hypothetical protein [Flavobacteriales bacterium]|tara:strand:+ start:199 stop:1416 length:1218 start_codon:yes stop_codon:yes gene_type:complete
MFLKKIKLEGDLTVWTVVLLFMIFSFLQVLAIDGNAITHSRNLLIGLLSMYFVHRLKFKYFSKLSLVGIVLCIFLLIIVFFIGPEINDAKRWLKISSGLSFQPSDLAELILLIFLSRQISKYRDFLHNWSGFVKYLLLPILLVCSLIFPSNLSTAVLLFVNCLFLMIISKLHYKYLLTIVGVPFVLSLLIYSMFSGHFSSPNIIDRKLENHKKCFNKECVESKDICWRYMTIRTLPRMETWVSRLDAYFYPQDDNNINEGYQLYNAKIAIKRGGLFGAGPGKGIQKHNIYAPSSDFIFANLIEQYGIILGALPLVLLYLIFFYRSIIISQKTKSLFGSLMVASIAFSIILQAIGHMGVNIGLFPVTGQTLPLISQGGTSIIFTCISVGVILSVSRNSNDRNYETI